MVAAELQDSLLVVMHDLHRLEGLLSHATDNLMERFALSEIQANAILEMQLRRLAALSSGPRPLDPPFAIKRGTCS